MESRDEASRRHTEQRNRRTHSDKACRPRGPLAFTRSLTRPGQSKWRSGPGGQEVKIKLRRSYLIGCRPLRHLNTTRSCLGTGRPSCLRRARSSSSDFSAHPASTEARNLRPRKVSGIVTRVICRTHFRGRGSETMPVHQSRLRIVTSRSVPLNIANAGNEEHFSVEKARIVF